MNPDLAALLEQADQHHDLHTTDPNCPSPAWLTFELVRAIAHHLLEQPVGWPQRDDFGKHL